MVSFPGVRTASESVAQASGDADGATDAASLGATEGTSEGALDGDAPALEQAATARAMRPVARSRVVRTWITSGCWNGNGRECTGECHSMSYRSSRRR